MLKNGQRIWLIFGRKTKTKGSINQQIIINCTYNHGNANQYICCMSLIPDEKKI